MYEVLADSPKAIAIIYIIFSGACLITYPVASLIVNAFAKGVSK